MNEINQLVALSEQLREVCHSDRALTYGGPGVLTGDNRSRSDDSRLSAKGTPAKSGVVRSTGKGRDSKSAISS